jgi:hypothetical protein
LTLGRAALSFVAQLKLGVIVVPDGLDHDPVQSEATVIEELVRNSERCNNLILR